MKASAHDVSLCLRRCSGTQTAARSSSGSNFGCSILRKCAAAAAAAAAAALARRYALFLGGARAAQAIGAWSAAHHAGKARPHHSAAPLQDTRAQRVRVGDKKNKQLGNRTSVLLHRCAHTHTHREREREREDRRQKRRVQERQRRGEREGRRERGRESVREGESEGGRACGRERAREGQSCAR